MSNNRLIRLPASNVFNSTSSLTTLVLSGNLLTELPTGFFDTLSNLRVLRLDQNPLQNVQFPSPLSALSQLWLTTIALKLTLYAPVGLPQRGR